MLQQRPQLGDRQSSVVIRWRIASYQVCKAGERWRGPSGRWFRGSWEVGSASKVEQGGWWWWMGPGASPPITATFGSYYIYTADDLFHNQRSVQAWLDTSCAITIYSSCATQSHWLHLSLNPPPPLISPFYTLSFLLHVLPSPACTAHLLFLSQSNKKNLKSHSNMLSHHYKFKTWGVSISLVPLHKVFVWGSVKIQQPVQSGLTFKSTGCQRRQYFLNKVNHCHFNLNSLLFQAIIEFVYTFRLEAVCESTTIYSVYYSIAKQK